MSDKSEDKKNKILASAYKIIGEKGLANTTISEISKESNVSDSVIYQHFKGKEDLLFSVLGIKVAEFLRILEEHLLGIRDAENKLSKLVWTHLWFHDNHPGFTRILLLECLSSKEFYNSKSYKLIQKYAQILVDILKQGVKEKRFGPELNVHLMRNILYGLLNAEVIYSYTHHGPENSSTDHEDIMILIFGMIKRENNPELGKSDRILNAAQKIFAQKGFKKATVLEIAQLAKVSEGTVYEYFENKEELLLSIPQKRFNNYQQGNRELFHIVTPLKKLRRFLSFHFSLFLKDEEFLEVFLLQLQFNINYYRSEVFESYLRYVKTIDQILREGMEDGSFRKDINPRVFRNMFLGTFSQLSLRWVLINRKSKSQCTQEINQVKELFSIAVKPVVETDQIEGNSKKEPL